jgi:aryl-alcohol dehydrogenase-like predicted oxidoreductase
MVPTTSLGALTVSRQGLGCVGMSAEYGPADPDESIATIRRALDLGVTFLDTADAYGATANEQLVGRAIRGRRDEVQLATKFGFVGSTSGPQTKQIRGDAGYVVQACEASLARLGVDHIDLYYLHRVDPDTPIEETVGAMSELVAAGKVRHLGLSEVQPSTILRAHAVHPIAAVQTEYSIWSREPEAELLGHLRALGIGFVAYSPLGRGFLTGKVRSLEGLADDDFRRRQPRFAGNNLTANLVIVECLQRIAARHEATAGQVALAWLQTRGDDIVPIPGTKRRAYLEENAAATTVGLTDQDLAEIATLPPPVGARYDDEAMARINR